MKRNTFLVITYLIIAFGIKCSKNDKLLNNSYHGQWVGNTNQSKTIHLTIEYLNNEHIVKEVSFRCILNNEKSLDVHMDVEKFGIQKINEKEFSFVGHDDYTMFINGIFSQSEILTGEIHIYNAINNNEKNHSFYGTYSAKKQ